MNQKTPPLLFLQQYALLGIFWLFALLPFTWLQRLGKLIGTLLRYFPNEIRRITTLNIQHAFPELSPAAQQKLIHSNLQHTLMCAMEMIAIWMKPPKLILKQIKEFVPMPTPTDTQGILLLGPHIGAWEIFTIFAQQYHQVVTLYRPPKKFILEVIIRRARQREGMIMMPTTAAGVKAVYHALSQKQVVAILPDQDPGEGGGIFSPFFGIDTWTMTLSARLARKSGAKAHMAYTVRNPIGKGFNIHIYPASDAIYDADLATAVAAMNQDVETIVRRHPEQYQWAYKRFKRQPVGKHNFYDTMSK
jgi:KDO2-lipid IV(A) lauroyltransferase